MHTPPYLCSPWREHTHVHTYTHSLTQQEADSRRSERDLTMTLQCYTPTPSSSVEVTAQPADVLSVNYTHNTLLPIVSAAVHRCRRCEQNICTVYSNTPCIYTQNSCPDFKCLVCTLQNCWLFVVHVQVKVWAVVAHQQQQKTLIILTNCKKILKKERKK